MSDDGDVFAADERGRRGRPFLFPWNRRLRHLQGISIRNLNIGPPSGHGRRKTITDDDVPYNLQSSAKRLAQSESKMLQHSRSFSDLTSPSKGPQITPKKTSTSFEKKETPKSRPGGGKLRRRSTLHWTGASPMLRQQKLEDVAAGRLADTWFSIHCEAVDEPVYVSEVMPKSMNPTFRFFDLTYCGPQVTRMSQLRLNLWAKNDKSNEYTLLLDFELSLSSLQFIGKGLENFHHPLPENCVLFYLTDGIYTSFTDMPVEGHGLYLDYAMYAKRGHRDTTSSYDALMRLQNLDECIQDALKTREKLESQINALLAKNEHAIAILDNNAKAEERRSVIERTTSTERRHLQQALKKRAELQQSFELRSQTMKTEREAQTTNQTRFEEARKRTKELEAAVHDSVEKSSGQIRRICEELALIYPIEPIKNKALHFSICGIHLPNSAFDDTNRDEIAAALGFTAHLVYLLSMYLSIPLPYPITANGSTSFIEDPISVALAQRTFPLHPTNASFKFEYGVLILNKDIEFLMNKSGLRMLDIRHTLPNLKYLMYVLTAGRGELPARRAGGVKGLLLGRATPTLSRRGSEDSVTSGTGWAALDAQIRNSNNLIASKGKGKEQTEGVPDASRAFPPMKVVSRSKNS